MTSERWRVGRPRIAGAVVLAIVLMHSAIASAERITVLCSNGFKAVLQEVAPQFEKATKHEVSIGYSVSAELRRRIEGGERFDVAILTPGLMDEMIRGGHVAARSRAVLARSPMALAVRRGAAKPDVRTVDSLKASLVASRSIAFAKEGSGGYCITCHNQRTATAGWRSTRSTPQSRRQRDVWERVIAKLRAGSMPPPGRPRPDAATYHAVAAGSNARSIARGRRIRIPGRIGAVHRLNRTEYNNAIRDLFALDLDVKPLLPGDETADGSFDNFADVLSISTAHLERYLSVARQVTRLATGLPPRARR
jgi:hypothetical protein